MYMYMYIEFVKRGSIEAGAQMSVQQFLKKYSTFIKYYSLMIMLCEYKTTSFEGQHYSGAGLRI